jgi:hypothetical protein
MQIGGTFEYCHICRRVTWNPLYKCISGIVKYCKRCFEWFEPNPGEGMFANYIAKKEKFCPICLKEQIFLGYQGDGCIAWRCRGCMLREAVQLDLPLKPKL